ncbi:leucine-rich repeat domain-containing protein [Roseimaritima ulvae]|uniref:Leucine Rich repeats (2 copies) n=1 Tax=Roseimaritima ulvae TaxID=980254 RepID=A0A5B9QXH1_9BACT|nr:hypothetical protein [Roseimaritima ulvae]QEG43717.1 Leucine Rich repeats (2 copies) [Roseimaritima ulvae]
MHWHIRSQSKLTATPAVHLSMAVCLLVVAEGCQREATVASPQTDVTEHYPGAHHPAKTSATVFFTQQADGFVAFPFLSSQNVDEFIAEVNARDVRKLTLKPHPQLRRPGRLSVAEQLALLPKIIRGCPNIESLRLHEWTLRISALAIAAQSENLQELAVLSCTVINEPVDAAAPGSSNLRTLTLTSCLGGREAKSNTDEPYIAWTNTIDQSWAQLLAWTPKLEELRIRAHFREQGTIVGTDWPLGELSNLRTVHLGDYVQDALVTKLLTETPNLESLSLSSEQLTGADWMPNKLSAIRDLELYGCKGISPEKMEAVLPSAPLLKSFSLSIWRDSLTARFDFSKSKNLQKLFIAAPGNKSHLSFRGLSAATELESLTLRGMSAEALSSVKLSQFEKLRTLHLVSYGATQNVLADLPASLESIRLASFAKTKSEPATAGASFAHLTQLTSFTFDGGSLEAELIESLPSSVTALALHHCDMPNSSVAALLSRLERLETLSLTWLHGGRGYADDPGAVTGEGWDFACGDQLRTLDLSKCFFLEDELIQRISEQLTGLESLKLAEQRFLTGRNWQLNRLPKLKELDLRELPKLTDNTLQQLPTSLKSLRVEDCDQLTGDAWQLDAFGKMTELRIAKCDSLRSLGGKLPASLERLNARYCPHLLCSELDYSSFAQLQQFSLTDCYEFDVKRLFVELPQHADSLRTLTLTGCESLQDADWDMSALNDTLQIVIYDEADPAYRGGLNKDLGEQLQQQLPDSVIVL